MSTVCLVCILSMCYVGGGKTQEASSGTAKINGDVVEKAMGDMRGALKAEEVGMAFIYCPHFRRS